MKTKILLTVAAVFTAFSLWAEEPKQVTWTIVENILTEGSLPMTESGTLIFGDYNNDGYLDALMMAGTESPLVGLYKSNGNGTFTEVATEIFPVAWASAAFIDIDNDGNLDLVVAGSMDGTAEGAMTFVYRNSGAPNFTFQEDIELMLVGVSPEEKDNGKHILVPFDYNNDGWMDLLVNGNAGGDWDGNGNSRVVAIYKNNKGTFELVASPVEGADNFHFVNGGSAHVGDVNNDGFADIIISGYEDEIQTVTYLYLNNKNGKFTLWEPSASTFTGHMQGETFFVDINNDGWNDIVEIGRDVANGWAGFANVFMNNKDNTFTKVEEATNLKDGQAYCQIGDINNDGWMDIFIAGWGGQTSAFAYNNGDNTFTSIAVPDITRARSGAINLVDFTGDNNLDYTIYGYRDGESDNWPSFFVKNDLGDGIASNNAPDKPANFAVRYENGQYLLSWDKANDDITPADAMRYNIFIKYADGKTYSYVAAAQNGKLKVSGIQPFIMTNSIALNLPEGGYTFGVQAIDQAFAASEFTTFSTTGVDETSVLENISVSVNGKKIEISNNLPDAVDYTIISVTGQVLNQGYCAGSATTTVDSNLNPGIYLVKLSQGNVSKTVKILF